MSNRNIVLTKIMKTITIKRDNLPAANRNDDSKT